jgi:hypothetical protein
VSETSPDIDVDSTRGSAVLAGHVACRLLQHEQHEVIRYLREENWVLKACATSAARFTDDERRRLAYSARLSVGGFWHRGALRGAARRILTNVLRGIGTAEIQNGVFVRGTLPPSWR